MGELENDKSENNASYGKRAVKAGGWLMALQVVGRLSGLIQQVVLARLLAPNDFGIMSIALITIEYAEVFSNPNLAPALIQKKGDIGIYLNSLWTYQVIRGFVVTVAVYCCAPFVAGLFKSPDSVNILKALSVVIFIRSFQNPGMVQLRKDIEFRPQFVISSVASFFGMLAAVTYALVNKNVWALVVGLLVTTLINTGLSFTVHSFRPRLEFTKEKFRVMFRFGGWVWISAIIVVFVTKGGHVVVARMLGPLMLGYFTLGFSLGDMPATQLTNLLAQVTFPVYSKFHDDLERLDRAYSHTLQFVLSLTVPFAVALGVLAEPVTMIVFGAKWLPMVPVLQISCLAGLARCMTSTFGPVFLAMGRPRISTMGQIIRMGVLFSTVFYGIKILGMTGAACAVLLSVVASLVFFVFEYLRYLGVHYLRYFKVFLPSAVAGAALTSVLLLIQRSWVIGDLVELIGVVLIGGLVYVVVLIFMDRFTGGGIRLIISRFGKQQG